MRAVSSIVLDVSPALSPLFRSLFLSFNFQRRRRRHGHQQQRQLSSASSSLQPCNPVLPLRLATLEAERADTAATPTENGPVFRQL